MMQLKKLIRMVRIASQMPSLQLYTLLFLLRQHLKMLRVRKRLRKRLMRSLAMRIMCCKFKMC
ncbi:unnamed protein product [Brassica rapa subsp. narinosa]